MKRRIQGGPMPVTPARLAYARGYGFQIKPGDFNYVDLVADMEDALFRASWERMVLLAAYEQMARKYGDLAIDIAELHQQTNPKAYSNFDAVVAVRNALEIADEN